VTCDDFLMLIIYVTLTFDLLTLNTCSSPGVMWANYEPNLSEIDKSEAVIDNLVNFRTFSPPIKIRGLIARWNV